VLGSGHSSEQEHSKNRYESARKNTSHFFYLTMHKGMDAIATDFDPLGHHLSAGQANFFIYLIRPHDMGRLHNFLRASAVCSKDAAKFTRPGRVGVFGWGVVAPNPPISGPSRRTCCAGELAVAI